MGQKFKFADGEKVLCFHGPLIYEAKCLKSSVTKDKLVRYFIHYAGWNKNWDEWVPESRVLKYNDANVQRQKEVLDSHQAVPIKSTSKKSNKSKKSDVGVDDAGTSASVKEESTPKASIRVHKEKDAPSTDQSAEPPKKKRGRVEQLVEQPNKAAPEEPKASQTKITLPEELKQILVNDWHLVVQQQKLVNLPAKTTITQLFEDYKNSAKLTSDENVAAVNGIKDYFNHALTKQLLYEAEQTQHESLVKDKEVQMCDIYGIMHLLRMFTKFGSMLAHLEMEEKSQQFLLDFIKKFLLYVAENKSNFFGSDDYISK